MRSGCVVTEPRHGVNVAWGFVCGGASQASESKEHDISSTGAAGAGSSSAPKFEVKRWNAVAMWAWGTYAFADTKATGVAVGSNSQPTPRPSTACVVTRRCAGTVLFLLVSRRECPNNVPICSRF